MNFLTVGAAASAGYAEQGKPGSELGMPTGRATVGGGRGRLDAEPPRGCEPRLLLHLRLCAVVRVHDDDGR